MATQQNQVSPMMTPHQEREAKQLAIFKAAQRTIGAMIVAFAFVVVLIAASAQQDRARRHAQAVRS
jgi:hypothetical protein